MEEFGEEVTNKIIISKAVIDPISLKGRGGEIPPSDV